MEETFNIKAIVLRRLSFKETDARITVYSRERGKLNLTVRGTVKPKSKLAGHIEPITLVNLMVIKGRQYDYAGTALAVNAFLGIKKDLAKTQTTGEAINIFNKLIKEEEADENLFFLLHDFLVIVDSGLIPEEKLDFFKHLFLYKLFVHLGYGLQFDACSICKKEFLGKEKSLDFLRGGVVCLDCGKEKNSLTVSENCVKLLKISQNNDLLYLIKIKTDNLLNKEAVSLICSFYNYISDQ